MSTFIQRKVAFLAVTFFLVACQYARTMLLVAVKPQTSDKSWSSNDTSVSVVQPDVLDHSWLAVQPEEALVSPQLADLPLTGWELASAGPERNCTPPEGVPGYCCLGSASAGGGLRFLNEECHSDPSNMLSPYEKAQNISLHWLEQHPLPVGTTRQCDICQIIHVLLHRNLSLAFLGDSVTRQTFGGLECNLRRRGYNVTAQQYLKWPTNETRWRYKMTDLHEITVSLEPSQHTTIRYFAMYRPSSLEIEKILGAFPVDILVFDHGLHFRIKDELKRYINDTRSVLELLARHNVPLKVWRETSAQHYSFYVGGHFDMEAKQRANSTSCAAVREADTSNSSFHASTTFQMANEMNWTVLDASEADFVSTPIHDERPELIFMPFRQLTMPLWDLHPKYPDCSHFCSTPYLWLPIWRNLRLAMDRMLRNNMFNISTSHKS